MYLMHKQIKIKIIYISVITMEFNSNNKILIIFNAFKVIYTVMVVILLK